MIKQIAVAMVIIGGFFLADESAFGITPLERAVINDERLVGQVLENTLL